MKNLIGCLLCGCLVTMCGTQDAHAFKEFKDAFNEKYVEKHKSDDFKAAFKKATCNVCHIKGVKKPVQNEYGMLLNKFIEGDAKERKDAAKKEGGSEAEQAEVKKLLAELDVAFAKVADMESKTGPKFGELIKEGRLPVDPDEALAEYKKKQAEEGDDSTDNDE